ncbi:MAG: hypothetical protein KJO07_02055, partial [Deltaproteobacteria bacterium]|nr:hypothetical protein [Deltaproteobacteria bacterium]
MTARWIGVLLAATLIATVAVRSAGLVEMVSRRTLTVEISRWQDRELAADVERAIGHWLAQVPQPDLHTRYIDRPELSGRARLSIDGRTAELGLGPSAAQLRPPLETLIARIGRPQRVFLVTTDRPVDQRFATGVRGLLAELSIERIVEVPAARRLED